MTRNMTQKNKTPVNTDVLPCGRWDLNPHERIAHKILSLARLPVPTLPLDLRHELDNTIPVKECQDFLLKNLFENICESLSQKRDLLLAA